MERWIVKLIVLHIIFFVVLGATLLPLKVANYFQRQGERGIRVISYLMCFGGGVFLAMYMLQMAPDAKDLIEEFICEPNGIDYPVAEFVMGLGVLVMLLSEMAVKSCSDRRDKRSENKKNKERYKNKNKIKSRDEICKFKTGGLIIDITSAQEMELRSDDVFSDVTSGSGNQETALCVRTDKEKIGSSNIRDTTNNFGRTTKGGHHHVPLMNQCSGEDGFAPLLSINSIDGSGRSPLFSVDSTEGLSPLLHVGIKIGLTPLFCLGFKDQLDDESFRLQEQRLQEAHIRHQEQIGGGHVHASRSLILLFALSLHHVFEGLGIGLKHSQAAVWNMCIAICSHEIIIAFSLGMQLIHTFRNDKFRVVVAAFICSVMSPIGIAAGMAIIETGGQDSPSVQIANGLLQALATGIFIYVTFFEILQDELGHDKSCFSKVLAVSAGFVILSSFGLFVPSGDEVVVQNSNETTYIWSSLNFTHVE